MTVKLIYYDRTSSKPILIDSEIIIQKSSFHNPNYDSSKWQASAICNIKLMDSCKSNERFYIVEANRNNQATTILILQTPISATALVNSSVLSGKINESYVHLDNTTSFINPIYIKDSILYDKVPVKLSRDTIPSDKDTDKIVYSIDSHNFPFILKLISRSSYNINGNQWNRIYDSSKKTTSIYYLDTLIIQNQSIKDTLSRDLSANIHVNEDKSYHEIVLTEKGIYKSKPFWIETGANFDLLDGVKANNLYTGIFMFEKDIARISNKKSKIPNLSFTGGVYESKSSSFSESSDSGLIYRDGSSYLSQFDTASQTNRYRFYRDTGSITTTTDVQSIGIFFSPHLRLSKKPTEEFGFHIFASAYLEMLWQRVKSNFDYKNLSRDSVYSSTNADTIYNFPFKETKVSSDYRTQYLGLGFPIYISEKAFSLYINDVFGWCNQRFVAVQDSGLYHNRTNCKLPQNSAS